MLVSIRTYLSRVRAVTETPFSKVPFSPPQGELFLGLPEGRYYRRKFPFAYHETGMGREGAKPFG